MLQDKAAVESQNNLDAKKTRYHTLYLNKKERREVSQSGRSSLFVGSMIGDR